MTTKIRVSKKLYKELVKDATQKGRTVSEQLEICARLGMIIEEFLRPEEIELILSSTAWSVRVEPLNQEGRR